MKLQTEKSMPAETGRQSDMFYIGGASGSAWNEHELTAFAQR